MRLKTPFRPMRLMAAFLLYLTLAGAVQAQGLPECTAEFTFGSFDPGPIDLSPPAGQLPPQLDANGISLLFDSYVTEINGNPMMGSAFLDTAPDGIDSPNALLLTTTKAVFQWTAMSLGIADPVTEVAFQVVDAGTGLPINLSVNGESTSVSMVDMIPPDLPGGIAVDVQDTPEVEGLYTIALSGGGTAIERVEVGGTLAMGDLCLVTGDPNGGGDNGNGGDPCSTGPSFAVEVTMNTDNYPGETTWTLTDADGTAVLSGGPYNEAFGTFTASASLCAGCYTLSVLDGFGDGMCCMQGEGGFTVTIEGELVAEGGEFNDVTTVEVCTPVGDVLGCTYPVALNYDSLATDDDGSCVFDVIVPCDVDSDGDGVCDEDEVPGCTDPCSCSFNVDATEDDGSCWYAAPGYDCACSTPGAAVAPDFTAVDLNGVEHNLYGLLNAGKKVIIQFTATWSGPDFAYHSSGVLQSIWTDLGPDGEDQVRVFLIEGDDSTDINDLNGTGSSSAGDFVTGTDFPIIGDGEAIFESFGGAYYPYIVTICPNGQYTVTGQTSYAGHVAALEACPDCPSPEISGCTYALALNYDPLATIDDGSCDFGPAPCALDIDGDGICDDVDPCIGIVDALGICNGNCFADVDGDGECDDEDCCVGAYDECGICNGPGAIFDCGCNALPAGACDCEGSQPDALGECGGDCPADLDSDGICDNVDDCVGDYDNCGICNGPGAVFSCGCFSLPATDCDCEGNQLDALGICGGGCPGDIDGDGICDTEEIPGCTDAAACNYAPNATDDDGSCEFPTAGYDCDSDCLNDQDGDGVCDSDEIYGCTDQTACNYDPSATENVGCLYATFGYDCFGQCLGDADGDGICDAYEVAGCTDSMACNFLPEATDDDGSCAYAGTVYDCDGNCLSDVNGNGICDALEEFGCMDPTACNYNPLATTPDPNASCLYASFGYDCFGQCLDDDGDGICNVDEIGGCTYSEASNYDPTATQDDGSCTFPDGGSDDCPDLDGDGVVAISDLLTLLGAFGDTVDC